MEASARPRWLRAALLFGVVYLLAGLAFGELTARAATQPMVVAWRLAAWGVSAAAFAAHIGYEQVRLRTSPATTALHAAFGAALGAFGLAVAMNVHARNVAEHRPLRILALALWPLMTAPAAFVVALAMAAVLARMRRSAGPRRS